MPRSRRNDDSFVQFVVDQLMALGEVEARAMFGGFGLYCGGAFFGIVHGDRVYFKTDAASRKDYEVAGMEPFQPSAAQTLKNYMEIPPDVLEDAAELVRLAETAIAVARG